MYICDGVTGGGDAWSRVALGSEHELVVARSGNARSIFSPAFPRLLDQAFDDDHTILDANIDLVPCLRAKLGKGFGGLDAATVARAEEALKSLAGQFQQWLQDEIEKLEAARQAVHDQGPTPAAMEQLYLRCHDLKGLGATYEFPLISRVAGSLCRLMDGPEIRTDVPLFLVDAHIDAIRAIVRDEIRDPDHPTGRALAQALEMRVAAYSAEANGSSTAP